MQQIRKSAHRLARVLGILGTALICAAPADASSDPIDAGRLLHAAAHHQHGNRGPMIATSPGRHGTRRMAGYRIYEASAVHPFRVGFDHSLDEAAPHHVVPQIDVWLGPEGRRFDRPSGNPIKTP